MDTWKTVNFDCLKKVYNWLKNPTITRCVLCLANTPCGRICQSCSTNLPKPLDLCLICSKKLLNASICVNCQKKHQEIGAILVALDYQYPVDRMLLNAKHHQDLVCCRALGDLLASAVEPKLLNGKPEILVPMPLHTKRHQQRGYNQALEIAAAVSTKTGIPINNKSCIRISNTVSQTRLNAQQRHDNLRGAFAVNDLGAAHIAIIDDVLTTGSSVSELAKACIAAGAKRVDVWACASRK